MERLRTVSAGCGRVVGTSEGRQAALWSSLDIGALNPCAAWSTFPKEQKVLGLFRCVWEQCRYWSVPYSHLSLFTVFVVFGVGFKLSKA